MSQNKLKKSDPSCEIARMMVDYDTWEKWYRNENRDLYISSYVRAVNICQIIHIFWELPFHIKSLDIIKEVLLESLDDIIHNTNIQEELRSSVYDLIEKEICRWFPKSKCSMKIKMYKIAYRGLQTEYRFHQLKAKHIYMLMKKTPFFYMYFYNTAVSMKRMLQAWHIFMSEYAKFIKALENNETVCSFQKEEADSQEHDFKHLFQFQNAKEYYLSDYVIKNTISFVRCMKHYKETEVSKTFFSLFNPYAKALALYQADTSVAAAHIHIFRVQNIQKILFMMEIFNIDFVFKGYDVTYFLSKPLGITEQTAVHIDMDETMQTLQEDADILIGKGASLESTENIGFLFCSYLDIERIWALYESDKKLRNIKKTTERIYTGIFDKSASILNEWFEYCSKMMNYRNKGNQISGKVLDLK